MNKIQLFFLLRKNTKLSEKRNPMFEANQYSKLFGYIMASILAIEFIARKGDPYIGIPLKDLNTRKGSLVSVIVHQGKIIIPFGNDHIEEGDHVIIVSRNLGISDLNEVLYR